MLAGTVTDESDIQSMVWSNNRGGQGEVPALSKRNAKNESQWSVNEVDLSEGENILMVRAVDGAGNIGTDELRVFKDAAGVNRAPKIIETKIPHTVNQNALVVYSVRAEDGDGDALTFFWEFGDGETAEGAQVEHAFLDAGVFLVRLTVTDVKGAADSAESVVVVEAINRHPVVTEELMIEPLAAVVGQTIDFSIKGVDPDGDELSYAWSFGEGSSVFTKTGKIFHTYDRPGEFFVVVDITDSRNGLARTRQRITISPTENPAFGARPQVLSAFTSLGRDANPMNFEIWNAGTGSSLPYEVRGAENTEWLQVTANRQGSISSPDNSTKKITVTFDGSRHLARSAKLYTAELEIVSSDTSVLPIKILVQLAVTQVGAKVLAKASAQGKITVTWEGVIENDIDFYEVSAFAKTDQSLVRTLCTERASAVLAGLPPNRDFRIVVKAINREQGVRAQVETESRTVPPTTYAHEVRFNHVAQNDQWWTGVSLLNPGKSSASFLFEALDFKGRVLETSSLRQMAAGEKSLGDLSAYFSSGALEKAATLLLKSDRPLTTLELFGTHDRTLMTGVPTGDTANFTSHILVGEHQGAFSTMSLVNPFGNQAELQFEAFNAKGGVVNRGRLVMAPYEKRALSLSRLIHTGPGPSASWVRLSSDQAISGFALWGNLGSTLNGQGLLGAGSLTTVLPGIGPGTRIYLANPAEINNRVILRHYRPTGEILETLTVDLLPKEHLTLRYDDPGSIGVTAQYPVLVNGDFERSDRQGKKLGESIPGISEFHDNLIVPHVASNAQWRTELRVANVDDRETVLSVEAFHASGEALDSVLTILAGHANYVKRVRDIFPGLAPADIAYLKIKGLVGARLAGQLLFYTSEGRGEVMGGSVLFPDPSQGD